MKKAELDQAGAKATALNPLFLEGFGQLSFIDELVADQQFSEPVTCHPESFSRIQNSLKLKQRTSALSS
jgi:hypothetical protein